MVSPYELLDLAFVPEDETADAAEAIARAADIVERFAGKTVVQALDALIATTELDSLGEAALCARGITQQTLHQAQILDSELDRFLAATDKH